MYYSCGCYCGCNTACGCYQTSCCNCTPCTTTTTTTTTINPDCEPCDEFYNCECVIYNGEDISCYGLETGDNLCSILETIIENLPECQTAPPELNCDFEIAVSAADSVIFKAIAITNSKWYLISSIVPFSIDWGDGTIDTFSPGYYIDSITHDYTGGAYTGDIALIANNLSGITLFYDSYLLSNFYNGTSVTLEATEFGKLTGLVESELTSVKLLGNVKDIPRSLKSFVCWGRSQSSTVTGDVKDLPRNLTFINIIGINTLSGDVINLPRNAVSANYSCSILGNNTISGNVSNLPTTDFIQCQIDIEGVNTITGNVANIPSNYVSVVIQGLNTISGNIASVPNQLVTLWLTGSNFVSGNIQSLPPTIETIYLDGLNTVGGTLQSLVALDLTRVTILGVSSNVTWNIDTSSADFPQLLLARLEASTTVTGSIANLPVSIVEFVCRQPFNNIITGSISDLSAKTDLESFSVWGNSSTISGDIADLPLSVVYFNIVQNLGTLNQYTAGHIFSADIRGMSIETPAEFTGAEASDLLVDLNTYWTLGTAGNITLRVTGGEGALNGSGISAKASLITKGATVTII